MTAAQISFYTLPDLYESQFVRGVDVRQAFSRHLHTSFSLGMIERGERIMEVGPERVRINAGECFLLSPGQPHSCQLSSATPHDYCVLNVKPCMVEAMYLEGARSTGIRPEFCRIVVRDHDLFTLLRTLGDEVAHDGEALSLESLCTAIVEHALAQYARAAWQPETPCDTTAASVEVVKAYLEQHFDQSIRLEELAHLAHCSPFYLNRIFQQSTGLPPYEYLLLIRVKQAQAFLKHGESIASTAYLCGFSDQSHLTRVFKRHVGITPGTFLHTCRPAIPAA